MNKDNTPLQEQRKRTSQGSHNVRNENESVSVTDVNKATYGHGVLPGNVIDVKDLKKAKVFTVSMEQLSNSIKGFKANLPKELRTPQKNPRRVSKDKMVTSLSNQNL